MNFIQNDYFIFSPYFLKNISPTSGEKPVGVNLSKIEFLLVLEEASLNRKAWEAVLRIKAYPYQEVVLYKSRMKN